MTTNTSTSNIINFAQYQKLPEYPPDKETTWSYPKEEDGWMHAHNSLRAEMALLIASLESIPHNHSSNNELQSSTSSVRIYCLQEAWQCHYDHVHAHHTNEDKLCVPFLSTRFEYPHQHEVDHTVLVEKLEALHTMVTGLSVMDKSTIETLLLALREYQSLMLPHLAAEEEDSLPLMRAFFTPEEVAPMVQSIVPLGPTCEMGSFISCMGVEYFRNKFMVQEGIPDFLWTKDLMHRYQYFQDHFVTPLQLLKETTLLDI